MIVSTGLAKYGKRRAVTWYDTVKVDLTADLMAFLVSGEQPQLSLLLFRSGMLINRECSSGYTPIYLALEDMWIEYIKNTIDGEGPL